MRSVSQARPHCTRGAAARRTQKVRCAASPASKVETTFLGKSGLEVPVMGVGAWSWGDRSGYWGYGKDYGKEDSRQAYKAILDSGLTFIDTAEVYGFGLSEEFLGEFMKEVPEKPVIATKFAPLPWRLTAASVPAAAKASLQRLQMDSMGLYMIHWPGFFFNAFSNDAYVEGLAQVAEQGLAKAVGVSNFNQQRVRSTATALAARGTCLASNQVQYNLLYRAPETNGVFEACKENGVTLVAYTPLGQGLLTGKYKVGGPLPSGQRSAVLTEQRIRDTQPLLDTLKAIADARGKTMTQVALNWVICQGALPIPGVKSVKQLEEVAGAVGWRLEAGELAELDKASKRVPSALGAPFENW